jgi:hypothetical protein
MNFNVHFVGVLGGRNYGLLYSMAALALRKVVVVTNIYIYLYVIIERSKTI